MKSLFSNPDVFTDKAVLRLKDVQAIKRPTKRAQSNLYNLIYNTQSLVQGEAVWIRQGPDLVAVGRGTEYGWLNSFLEDALNWLPKRATLVSLVLACLANESILCTSLSCKHRDCEASY